MMFATHGERNAHDQINAVELVYQMAARMVFGGVAK